MGLRLGLGRLGITEGSRNIRRLLWPLGAASPGLWIAPRYVDDSFQDSAGTTALSAIGTVLDTSNPVGLVLDRKAGATSPADPGIHLSQSTSAARPVASARVNLLQSTESLTGWTTTGGNIAAATMTGWPNGIITGVAFTGAGISYAFTGGGEALASTPHNMSFFVQMDDGLAPNCTSASSASNDFDVVIAGNVVPGANVTVETIGSGVYRISGFVTTGAADPLGNNGIMKEAGNTARTFKASGYQLTIDADLEPYQRVNTASDYDASVAPVATKFDGVDDALASATFTANTVLTDGMDCLIAVRRDSTAAVVAGLYNAVADATQWFGMAESGSGSGCVGSGAGTPTVWVDGVQLTGGTAVTRDTLNTALTTGDVHILEFRDLDLSTWTAAKYGLYTGYVLNSAFLGDGIMLFPSTTDAIRDRARTALAASVGVTLP